MRRIGLPLFTVLLAAMCPAFGQSMQTLHVQSSDIAGMSILQVQHLQLASESRGDVIRWQPAQGGEIIRDLPDPTLPRVFPLAQSPRTAGVVNPLPAPKVIGNSGLLLASGPTVEFDTPNRGNVTFATPVVGDKTVVAFGTPTALPPVEQPAVAPAFPRPMPVANDLPAFQARNNAQNAQNPSQVFQAQNGAHGVPTNVMPTQTPAVAARPIAQNAVSQSHRLRLHPQVFERNLVERLGSRFVPVRNVGESPNIVQYRLPARDGTDIELVINKVQGMVFVTGSPTMVDASLRIVRSLDVEEVIGGPVARFVPVQQQAIDATRQVANIVNLETLRVAQAVPPVATGPLPPGLGEAELTAAGVVGPVNIETIPEFGTVIVQGSPEDVRIIQGILQQLEMLSLENEPIIELVQMRHKDSLRVYNWASQLYQNVFQIRRGPVIMLPLVKPNVILIVGRQESVEAAKEIIGILDIPAIPNTSFRVFSLKHAAAQDLLTTINNSFTGRAGAGQYLAPQVFALGDLRTNALIVHANSSDMLEVEAMIRELDIPGSGHFVVVKRFPLRNTMATNLVTVLNTALSSGLSGLYPRIAANRLDAQGNPILASVVYNVSITADTLGNSIIATAPEETMTLIEALIEELDRMPTAESRIRVFTLANGNAFDLTTVLTNVFGTAAAAAGAGQVTAVRPGFEDGESTLVGVRFQSDIRTNSIIAIGSEADLVIAEALLLRLDAANLNNRTVFTMRLINQPADEIAPILNTYFTNERAFNTQNAAQFLPNSPVEQYRRETVVIAEPITNSLVISTTPQQYEEVRQIILSFDERPLMVAIDVLIAEVTVERTRDRGVEFALQDSILFSNATNTRGRLNLSTGTVPFFDTGSTSAVGSQGITSLIPQTATGGFAFAASSEAVSIFIRALETQSRTQILSRPRLVTLHNRQAQIEVGSVVPYAGGTTMTNVGTQTTISERSVGTILDITPRIMPDGMIAIALFVERSSISGWRAIGEFDMPILNNTTASTTVNAMEGQTVIFAGLITEEKTTTNRSVPGLNKIPVVKHFFEYDSRENKRSELVIMLTPRLIRTDEDMMLLNQQERDRMTWCVSDVVRLTGNYGMKRRSDEWYPTEVRHIHGAPVILHESQLPAENRIPVPMFPMIETQ
ncbi:MAG: hypothetical protein FWE95_07590 [Planctomycetaceae bacterium]|nr:hypothetical protein [Planctomycetaceae bacterium]